MEDNYYKHEATVSGMRRRLKDLEFNLAKQTETRDILQSEKYKKELKEVEILRTKINNKYDSSITYYENEIANYISKKNNTENVKKDNLANKKQRIEDELTSKVEILRSEYDNRIASLRNEILAIEAKRDSRIEMTRQLYEGRIKDLEGRDNKLSAEDEAKQQHYDKNILRCTQERTRLETQRDNDLEKVKLRETELEERNTSKIELTLKADIERLREEIKKEDEALAIENIALEKWLELERAERKKRANEAEAKLADTVYKEMMADRAQDRAIEQREIAERRERTAERNRQEAIEAKKKEELKEKKSQYFDMLREKYPGFVKVDANIKKNNMVQVKILGRSSKPIIPIREMTQKEFKKEYPYSVAIEYDSDEEDEAEEPEEEPPRQPTNNFANMNFIKKTTY